MKKTMIRQEARERIKEFFKKKNFEAKDVKKIKRLAMKYRIPLRDNKKLFCKKCLTQLKGKIKIKKDYKIVECSSCSFKNRYKLLAREKTS